MLSAMPRTQGARRSLQRWRALACVAISLVVLSLARSAGAVPVRVRGGATIDLIATEGATDVTLRGQIADDVGASLGKATVRIEAVDADGRVAHLPAGAPCSLDDAASVRTDGDTYVVTTSERGDFCVKKPGDAKGLTFHARFVGNNFFDETETKTSPAPASEQRARTLLRFESPPTEIDLERESVNVVVSLKIDRADADRLAALGAMRREGLAVSLEDERGGELAKATTGGDGRARFELKAKDLASPGNGELRARFAGDGPLAPSTISVPVMRSAVVHLSATDPERGDPEAGIPIDVVAGSDHGVVDGGIVEALIGTDSVGSGNVVKGKARVVVSFAAGHRGEVPVTLRYISGAPFWRPGREIQVVLGVAGPSLWRHLLLGGLVAALTGWIVAKWRRSPETMRPESASLPPPSGRPEIVVVDRPSGIRGWKGTVTDAHDGFPIAGARLRVVSVGFDGERTLAEVTTDETGAFSLDAEAPEGARLVVEGDLHATYQQALPPPSLIRVALVTRRRAVLDRLVKWARSRGGAFDGAKEPTPGHVRRVASRTAASDVEAWARRVEHVAFGPDPVTRAVEDEVQHAEPQALPPADRGQAEAASPAGGPPAR